MQECTPEIIRQAAKRARLTVTRFTPHNEAYLISEPLSQKSFMASSWSLYPGQRNWHAGIMRHKELSSHFLQNAGFTTISGQYIHTAEFTIQELELKILEYIKETGFPVVIKPNTGSLSRNIYIIHTKDELSKKISEVKENITELLVQKYINQNEYRIFIYKGEILYLYKKQFVKNEVGLNRLEESPLDKSFMRKSNFPTYLEKLARDIYTTIDADIVGLDIFIEHDIAKEQEVTIIEMNHNPGLGVMYQTYNEKEFILEFLSRVYRDYLAR